MCNNNINKKIITMEHRKYDYYLNYTLTNESNFAWGCSRGVMVKAMDCGIVVSEFILQSHYYIYFRANTLGKGMNALILPGMG